MLRPTKVDYGTNRRRLRRGTDGPRISDLQATTRADLAEHEWIRQGKAEIRRREINGWHRAILPSKRDRESSRSGVTEWSMRWADFAASVKPMVARFAEPPLDQL